MKTYKIIIKILKVSKVQNKNPKSMKKAKFKSLKVPENALPHCLFFMINSCYTYEAIR